MRICGDSLMFPCSLCSALHVFWLHSDAICFRDKFNDVHEVAVSVLRVVDTQKLAPTQQEQSYPEEQTRCRRIQQPASGVPASLWMVFPWKKHCRIREEVTGQEWSLDPDPEKMLCPEVEDRSRTRAPFQTNCGFGLSRNHNAHGMHAVSTLDEFV